jgi:hypothetical protein
MSAGPRDRRISIRHHAGTTISVNPALTVRRSPPLKQCHAEERAERCLCVSGRRTVQIRLFLVEPPPFTTLPVAFPFDDDNCRGSFLLSF